MDMKQILQAMDGVATKPVVGVNDMSKFLSIIDKTDVKIINEGSDPHKVSLPVQMAMQHYQQPKEKTQPAHKPVGRETTIGKYFHKVESEIAEERTQKRNLINQYASSIAKRVMMKEAANLAQQAAIAIAKKKKKGVVEGEIPGHSMGFKPGAGPGVMPNEGMSAQVKLSRAWDREKAKSTASAERARQAKAEFEKEWKEKQGKQSQETNPIKESNKLRRLTKEVALPTIEPNKPKATVKQQKVKVIKPKSKTSSCRTGQVQTGVQNKDGKIVPKCSVR